MVHLGENCNDELAAPMGASSTVMKRFSNVIIISSSSIMLKDPLGSAEGARGH